MVGDGQSVGLWYDFRRRLPPGDYAAFYAECLEEIEEGERLPGVAHEQALENPHLFATEVAPRVRDAVGPKPA